MLLESGSRKGNQRNFCKNFNTVLPNCHETLGIDYKEGHLYSPVMIGGEIQKTFNRQLRIKWAEPTLEMMLQEFQCECT